MAEPSVADVSAWESIAIAAARRAAVLIRSSVGRAVGVGLKCSPTDVVTQTDVDAELLIRRMLLEATPSAGLIGEEGEPTSPAAELQWIVDPLDGTVNFTYAVPIFAVSIAAAYSGSIVAAAVVDVMRDEVFSAGLGTGSRLDGESIRTSECATLPTAMVATGFSYRAGLRVEQGEVVRHLLPIVRDIRCFGSAALELCWLACGRVDAVLRT